MTVLTITDTTRSEYLYASDVVYATAHNKAIADGMGPQSYVGNYLSGGTFSVYRAALEFDTSALPPGAIVTSARLQLFFDYINAAHYFTIVVQNGQPTHPADPVAVADYNCTSYAGNGGSLDLATVAALIGSYVDLNLNATGVTWINVGGVTKLMIRSANDIAGVPPGVGSEEVAEIANRTVVGHEPVLELSYTLPGPGTQTFDDITRGGALYNTNANYGTLHAQHNAGGMNQTLVIGQTPGYSIYRAFVYFDTSIIPADAIISDAKISLYVANDWSVTDFDITVQNGQPTWPTDPLVTALNFNDANYSGNGGTLNTAGLSIGSRYDINLNATGRGWINRGGITKLAIRDSLEIAGTPPGANELIHLGGRITIGQEAQLTVTWTPATGGTTLITDHSEGRGLINYSGVDYATSHAAPSASQPLVTQLRVDEQLSSWGIFRTALVFDTSMIPVGAVITAAKLKLYLIDDESYWMAGYYVVVLNGQPTYPHDPVQQSDYDFTHYSGNGGQVHTTALVLAAYNDLPLNPTGIGWLNPGGLTKLFLMSSQDIASTPPGAYASWVEIGDVAVAGQQPELEITWTAPLPPPSSGGTSIADMLVAQGII